MQWRADAIPRTSDCGENRERVGAVGASVLWGPFGAAGQIRYTRRTSMPARTSGLSDASSTSAATITPTVST